MNSLNGNAVSLRFTLHQMWNDSQPVSTKGLFMLPADLRQQLREQNLQPLLLPSLSLALDSGRIMYASLQFQALHPDYGTSDVTAFQRVTMLPEPL